MAEPLTGLVGVGGCLGGLLSYHLLLAKQGSGKKGEAAAVGGHRSPSKWASPPTLPMREGSPQRGASSGAAACSKSVSGDAFLTRSMADLGRLGAPGATQLDGDAFTATLAALIAEGKYLQNNPKLGLVPQERRAANVVLKDLEQFSTKKGGPLIIEELEYVPGRTNVKVVYPGTGAGCVSFVGMHFDVVPADPESGWTVDPFKLTVQGDKLYGRGTTDCLGHVALLTHFLLGIAKARPRLARTLVVVFIAAEEGGETGVGIDMLVKNQKLEESKAGPVFWIDTADSQPCCGSAGAMSWSLKCKGRLFHSGFPHKGINSIELASEVLSSIQERFYDDFPPHVNEEAYQFATGSTMKPTQVDCAKGSFNQICPECSIHGDIRLSPFYDVGEVKAAVEGYVKDLNASIELLPTRGPWSKFELPAEVAVVEGEQRRGNVELIWHGDINTFRGYEGIAVDLESSGHKALVQACREVYASAKPFSISGSLPLVRQLQKAGFDVQLCGFGYLSVYHGVNEYCTLSEMKKAYEVLARMVCLMDTA